ncbi:DUF192 domain-containing protein [Candidatus Peregrinibacteria bacterium]|nr:DUF192 domain-containing protein [Candidatus Peregrinibacteria bacterium]
MLKIILISGICILFSACNMSSAPESEQIRIENERANDNLSQSNVMVLPKKRLLILDHQENSIEFNVEVAETPLERQQGLMFREKLPADEGMLFIFQSSGEVNFWMKNTLIPLDIIYINSAKEIVHIAKNAIPCEEEPCPLYSSNGDTQFVLEINAGLSDQLGIEIGDRVEWLE